MYLDAKRRGSASASLRSAFQFYTAVQRRKFKWYIILFYARAMTERRKKSHVYRSDFLVRFQVSRILHSHLILRLLFQRAKIHLSQKLIFLSSSGKANHGSSIIASNSFLKTKANYSIFYWMFLVLT